MLNFIKQLGVGEWIVIAVIIVLVYMARRSKKENPQNPTETGDEEKNDSESQNTES